MPDTEEMVETPDIKTKTEMPDTDDMVETPDIKTKTEMPDTDDEIVETPDTEEIRNTRQN